MVNWPFEAAFDDILKDPEPFIDVVFSSLASEFLVMPKGPGFVDYPVFERGYEALKAATSNFTEMLPKLIVPTILEKPISLVVLRTILGFSPSEWAYVASETVGVAVSQTFARRLDREARLAPESQLNLSETSQARLDALVEAACQLLSERVPGVSEHELHRLDKVDTKRGLETVRNAAGMGVPYAMLLYERFLGRPFASHRDSVSELVGDRLESAVEDLLSKAGISFRKTKRAEKIEGFDQAPDFMIPSEFNPQVIIEAKVTEDDGTARDKVTRIQYLAELSEAGQDAGKRRFEVVACIGGRGFGIRREDMRKLLIATRGKVFTPKNLERLVDTTRLRLFRTR